MVLKKLACELALAIPLFEIPVFTVWTGLYARGQTLQEAIAQVRMKRHAHIARLL